MKAIGLMSGTSLDGLDIAYCDIQGNYTDTKVKLLDYQEVKMPHQLKEKIQYCCQTDGGHVQDICSLNFELGSWFGECTKTFMDERHITSVDYIASHGQTIYHIPEDTKNYHKSTLQIGEPALIAYQTNCQVVANFRAMDMAAQGQGAPLVPYADYLLYRDDHLDRILLNIGGISNITYLKKGCLEMDVFAFDTGPGNMLIDEAMRHFYNLEYDRDGKHARNGHLCEELYQELMGMNYIHMAPPKSTGRELFGKQLAHALFERYTLPADDFITTLTYFTADSIAYNIMTFTKGCDELIVAGGGAFNRTLLERLQMQLPKTHVLTQEDLGYSSNAKEAIAFVILGNETLHHHYANMISATGAKRKMILGAITLVTKEDFK